MSSYRSVVLGLAMVVAVIGVQAKTTVATANGSWSGAVWNNGVPAAGDTVVINSGVSVELAAATPYLAAFTNNGTLTFIGWETSLAAAEVVVNGTVTHLQQTAVAADEHGEWLADNRVWIICTNLTVAAGKMIDANGKGFTIGPGNNSAGTGGRDGAGHGGVGGKGRNNGGPVYGSTNAPVTPGSGGGAQSAATGGQVGGGVVRIEAAGEVAVAGTIQADGLPQGRGSGDKGGGSGGSVWIDCRGIAGTGGIRVRGGNAGNDVSGSGGGGGGRIAVYYEACDIFGGSVIVEGGYKSVVDNVSINSGQPGTLVRQYVGSDPLLTIVSDPPGVGEPAPYTFGAVSMAAEATVANSAVTPFEGDAADERFLLLGWRVATNGVTFAAATGSTAFFTMPATNATLEYLWTNQFALEAVALAGGAVAGSPSGWYTNGSLATLTATADSGYYFSQWIGDVPVGSERDSTLAVTMDQARHIQAVFGSAVPSEKVWHGSGEWGEADLWSPPGVPGANDDVVIADGSVTLPYAVWIADMVVSNGAKVVFKNWGTALNGGEIDIFGMLTHAPCVAKFYEPEVSNRVNVACASLWVRAGGAIDAAGQGYAPMGPGGQPTSSRHGGSHGGKGGNGYAVAGETYGSVSQPSDPGSSGGAQLDGPGGGKGGGAVRLQVVGRLTLDGTITANGKGATADTGGGAGGSVWITCATVVGNGIVRANGGPANNTSAGGGGGGRVALHYDPVAQAAVTPKPQLRLSVACGSPTSTKPGSLGSLYVSDAQVLPSNMPTEFNGIIHNVDDWSFATLVCSGLVEFAETEMRLSSAGDMVFGLPPDYKYRPALSAKTIDCGGALTLARCDLSLVSEPILTASGLTLADSTTITVNSAPTNGVAPGYGALVEISGAGHIGSGCWIYPVSDPYNGGSPYFHFNTLEIAAGGGFNGNTRGFAAAYNAAGYGPGAGRNGNAGGGYGGLGGNASAANGGLTNGVAARPGHPGSAGRSANNSTSGFGGGYVRLDVARRLSLKGTVTVNGGNAPPYNGAAAGGGIYITCGTFIGAPSGALLANGGVSANENYSTRGGGGGRIAVWRVSDINGQGTVATEVYGGVVVNASGASGTDGTVFWGWSPSDGTVLMLR